MSEKTEQPTPKKLRDARKKGQVAKSKEIPSAVILIGLFAMIWIFWGFFLDQLTELISLPPTYYDQPFDEALPSLIAAASNKLVALSLPAIGIAFVLAIAANFFQVGVLFAFESLKPDLNKLNPAQGIKKIFSMDNLIELIKSIVKTAFLTVLLYMVIKSALDALVKIPHLGLHSVQTVLGAILKQVAIYTSIAYLIVAAVDYFLQKRQHIKKLKMTKDEVKREFKESEGDPMIKGKRKQLHKELVMNDAVERTRKSSVLVTNPHEIAVAILYDEEKTKLPVVLTKGQDILARRMIEVAHEEGIPVMQNIPLAHDLYDQAAVDHFIPSDLIQPVAEVLRWVQQLKQEQGG